jgi:preprotein translocase subunit SecY
MWEKLRVVFSIEELRSKIFFTLFLLAIYRVGYHIPLPVINQERMQEVAEQDSGSLFGGFIDKVAIFSASDLRQATIFGLGIMPYISASIIFQLLGTVWKPIEELQKEGEAGRKKINEYTRYLTVFLCFVQSWMYVNWHVNASDGINFPPQVDKFFVDPSGPPYSMGMGWIIISVLTMTCGTMFLMWLGEQIDEYGIGNGISLLIMAGILARMPRAATELIQNSRLELTGFEQGVIGIESLLVLVAMFVAIVLAVVFITLGQRQIPTQSQKHVRGRRVYGGTKQFLPLKLNQSGVMPIIFASSLLMFPQLLLGALANNFSNPVTRALNEMFHSGSSYTYNILYIALIYFFCYFWTAIQFNPTKMADDLKNFGTFIPGYRPGRRTADYLEKVMLRITYVGAAFLALLAIMPTIVASTLGVPYDIASFYGGTGLLIAVSVAFDLVQKIDSHLVMRNYRGLLEG